MATTDAPFITTAQVGAFLRDPNAEGDLLTEMAVDIACSEIRDACAQQLMPGIVDDTVVLDGPGTDALLLPELPVTGVASVYLGSVEIDPTSYVVNRRLGAILTKSSSATWMKGRGLYTVTYSHGYATPLGSGDADWPAFPRSLVKLAIIVAARFIQQGIVKAEAVNGVNVTYSSDDTTLTKGELDIIAKHRQNL